MDKAKRGEIYTPENIAKYMSRVIIYHYLTENLLLEENSYKIKELTWNLVCKNSEIKESRLANKIYMLLKGIKILEPSFGKGILVIEIYKLIMKIIKNIGKTHKNIKKEIFKSFYGFEIKKNSVNETFEYLNRKISDKIELFNFKNDDFLLLNLNKRINEKFDLIIANPPYIKEKENKELFTPFKNSEYYQGRMDIWYLFLQYSIELLKDGGITTYIIPNNWITSNGASKLIKSIKDKTRILSVIDFNNYEVFEDASIQTMVLTLKKEKTDNTYYCYYKSKNRNTEPNDFLYTEAFKKVKVSYRNNGVIFTDEKIIELLNKISKRSNFKLLRLKEVTQGIVHPQNTVSESDTLKGDFKLKEGIFVINTNEKLKLNLTKKEKSIVKPTYTTKELKKYFKKGKPKFWTIYTSKEFNKPEIINKYPNIKKHLDKYKEIITSYHKPYGLHRARKEYFFKKGPKIILPRKSLFPTFTYMEEECYPTFTFNVIKTDRINLKYLTLLLNSKIIAFWLKYRGKMQGKIFQIDISPLIDLPIVNNVSDIKLLEDKFNILFKVKKIIPKVIKEIDEIIYRIYGLTSEEIAIIESNLRESHEKYLIY